MKNKCIENAEQRCKSYPNCYGCGAYRKPTNYDRIRKMSVEEMAMFFATNEHPGFPHSPCNVCEYDDGLCCTNENGCTNEYKAKKYQEWLESEVVQ